MISRRTFLQQAGTTLAGWPLLGTGPITKIPSKKHKWGIILNTVRDEMKEDYAGTLTQLADMGYKYIEGGSYGESDAAYYRLLKKLGLKAVIGGSSMANLQEHLDDFLRRGENLRYRYITCYYPWMSNGRNLTKAECLEAAGRLNQLGRRAKAAGFDFTWHNHDKEFVDIEGQTALDWLMQETDPEYVNLQMDIYWVYKGGGDAVEIIKKYPGRIKLLHVKDMDRTPERAIACVGDGQLDFRPIFDLWKLAGVDYATVEHERSVHGIACARGSIDHLMTIR